VTLSPRFRLAFNAADPPAPEAITYMLDALHMAEQYMRRLAEDETLGANARQRAVWMQQQLGPTEGTAKWEWAQYPGRD